MIFVFFIYGLSFFILGLSLFIYPKKASKYKLSKDILFIAAFAVLHGINEWIDMFILILEPMESLALGIIGMIFLPGSFFFLIQFGIRSIFETKNEYSALKILPIILLAIWGTIAVINNYSFIICDIWSRYLLGVPGIFLTSYALFLQFRKLKGVKNQNICKYLIMASGAFLFYGIFSGLITDEAQFFPASIVNSTVFIDKVGIPVQVFRAFCALIIAGSLTYVLKIFDIEANEELRKSKEEVLQTNKDLTSYQKRLGVLLSKISSIEEHERKLISQELHDNIGQLLALSKIKIATLQESYPIHKENLDEIRKLIEQIIKYTRSLTFDLANPILYQMGLQSAVAWLIEKIEEKHGITVEFISDKWVRDPKEEVSVILFKIVRELLFNIVKHAQAKKAVISMSYKGTNIHINVEDNGRGFDYLKFGSYLTENQSIGIFNIRERIKYLDGSFEIVSKKGSGTRVAITVPAPD